jgi:hypothetical protein
MRQFLHAIFAATMAALLVVGSALPSDAVPRHARYVPARTFDGVWSVSIVTYYGDCTRGYRYPLRIADGRVVKADDDPNYSVYGAVSRSGAIGVTISGGGQTASGTGRLTRNSGAGIWHTSNGECSGRWTAERRE